MDWLKETKMQDPQISWENPTRFSPGFVVLVVLALFSLQAVPNLHYGIRCSWGDAPGEWGPGIPR